MTHGHELTVRAVDCDHPGQGSDSIWIGGPGALAMPAPPATNLAEVRGTIEVFAR
jgi:hypothetical protein